MSTQPNSETPQTRGVQVAHERSEAVDLRAEACERLHALLRAQIHDSNGRQVSTIIAQACAKVVLANRSRTKIDLNGCQVSRINVGMSKLLSGQVAPFLPLIRLDPDLFFNSCEHAMEEKRDRRKQPQRQELPLQARAEMMVLVDMALSAPSRTIAPPPRDVSLE